MRIGRSADRLGGRSAPSSEHDAGEEERRRQREHRANLLERLRLDEHPPLGEEVVTGGRVEPVDQRGTATRSRLQAGIRPAITAIQARSSGRRRAAPAGRPAPAAPRGAQLRPRPSSGLPRDHHHRPRGRQGGRPAPPELRQPATHRDAVRALDLEALGDQVLQEGERQLEDRRMPSQQAGPATSVSGLNISRLEAVEPPGARRTPRSPGGRPGEARGAASAIARRMLTIESLGPAADEVVIEQRLEDHLVRRRPARRGRARHPGARSRSAGTARRAGGRGRGPPRRSCSTCGRCRTRTRLRCPRRAAVSVPATSRVRASRMFR